MRAAWSYLLVRAGDKTELRDIHPVELGRTLIQDHCIATEIEPRFELSISVGIRGDSVRVLLL